MAAKGVAEHSSAFFVEDHPCWVGLIDKVTKEELYSVELEGKL